MIEKKTNWYQNPYVWLVIAFPLTAVIAGLITIRIAVVSDDGLVTDDYYKKGLEINRVLERDNISKQAGLVATINLDKQSNKVKLLLSANNDFNFPSEIQVSFLNKTRKGFDQKLLATYKNNGLYEAELPELIRGNWYVQIETDDWRLVNSLTTN